jgi:CRP-like cAMP-binding protein
VRRRRPQRAAGAGLKATAEALTRCLVFAALPAEARARLVSASSVIELRTRQLLWREGARATKVGLVLHGRLSVERVRSRVVMLDIVGAGDLVGEVAFVLGDRYQFDVRCLRKARVAVFPSAVVAELLQAHGASLSASLAQQVLRLTRRLEAVSGGAVEQRLARVIVGLSERFGVDFPGGTLVPVRLRREDLAALAATTLESTSRQIGAWKRAGLVTPQPVGLLLHDLSSLRVLAGEGVAG